MRRKATSFPVWRICGASLVATVLVLPLHAQTRDLAPEPPPTPLEMPTASTRKPIQDFATASADFALQALSHLGVPYRFGGDDPKSGFDCSGLVRFVASAVLAIDLPRTSDAMARIGSTIARDALEVGDLLFFNTRGRVNSHVGIYIGDGRFVHAPSRRGAVRVEEVDAAYWRARFNGARRLLLPDAAADPPSR